MGLFSMTGVAMLFPDGGNDRNDVVGSRTFTLTAAAGLAAAAVHRRGHRGHPADHGALAL